jgi:hypothetical protein
LCRRALEQLVVAAAGVQPPVREAHDVRAPQRASGLHGVRQPPLDRLLARPGELRADHLAVQRMRDVGQSPSSVQP